MKLFICTNSISSVTFPFLTTIYQQENSDGYFNILVLSNSHLSVGSTIRYSYRIWDSEEWEEEYVFIQLDCREVNTGKYNMALMGGDVRGDWEINIFHSMACYVLTIKTEKRYGKSLMAVLTGCSYIFKQTKRPVLLVPPIEFFKAMLVRWTYLKGVMW